MMGLIFSEIFVMKSCLYYILSPFSSFCHLRIFFEMTNMQGEHARDLLSCDRDETLQLLRRWPRPWSSWHFRESRELQGLETLSKTEDV